jgi:uncharacterized protein
MKKVLIKNITITLITILFISCSSVKTRKEKESFFWKIDSDKGTVYLLGSIHIAGEKLYPLDNKIEKAYDEAQYLVVEADINNVNPMDAMKWMMYQDNRTLKSSLSDSSYKKLEILLNKHSIPALVYNKMKPWAAIMTVVALELKDSGFDESMGIDKHFLDKAKDKKKVLELESIDDQIKMLEEFDKVADTYLEVSINDINSTSENFEEMLNVWQAGDTKRMDSLMNVDIDKYPDYKAFMQKIVNDRNIKMTKKINSYLESGGTYFVVAGAGHIVGEKGIVNLLKKEGKYKLIPQ